MRESLRLGPTAPARTVGSVEDTVIGGKYAVEKGMPIIVNIYSMHRDPKIWGEDVRVFLTVHYAVVHSKLFVDDSVTSSGLSVCSTVNSRRSLWVYYIHCLALGLIHH